MSLSRRKLTAFAAAGLLLAVSACGDDGGTGGSASGDSSTTEWWHIQGEETALKPIWDEFAADFESQNEDASINITQLDNEAFKSRMTTAMQAGQPPDLFQSWGGGVLRQYVQAGLVRDLTDDLAPVIETISPGALLPYTIDGRVYGLPWDTGMVGVWYNKALFAQAGIDAPPETWSEFLTAVQDLKAAGITPIALGGADLWPGHFWWSYLAMRTAGLDALIQAGEAGAFESPEFVRAGELLQELVEMEPFQEGFLAANYDQPDGQAATMGNGEAAMELMGHWAPSAQADNSGTDGLGEDLGFFPFPDVEGGNGAQSEVFGGGNGFAVGINAPDATVDFLGYILDPANYQQVIDTNAVVPVLAEAADNVEDPNMQAVLATLAQATGFQLYLDQDYPPAVGAQVNDSVGALIAGQAEPDQVVQQVNDVWAREG